MTKSNVDQILVQFIVHLLQSVLLIELKSAQKVWNFWSYLDMRCIVLHTIEKHVLSALQYLIIYNHSQFHSSYIAFRIW